MNIIFLDVDGVLNNWKDAKEHYERTKKPYWCYDWPFSKKSMKELRKLIKQTNAKLVLSSTWRNDKIGRKKFKKALRKYRIEYALIGYTKYLDGKRELEIQTYLKKLNKKVNFIILDDNEYYFEELKDHLILINSWEGFNEEDTKKSIQLLKKQQRGKL